MLDSSAIDETKLILLLEHALVNYWSDNYDIKYLSNLKMHKIMYEVSEEENLPITRSWYMLGNNIHEREIVRSDFGVRLLGSPKTIILDDGRSFDLPNLIEAYSELYSEFKKSIKEYIDKTNIVRTNSWEFRRWLYKEKAPKKFSRCYLSSLEYLAFLSRFEDDNYLKSQFIVRDCTDVTTNIHASVSHIEEFAPFFELLVEFTDTLEDTILKCTLKVKDSSFTSSDLNFLQNQQQIFRDFVWKPFAKVISIETVKGIRKDEIIAEYSRDLQDLSSIKSQISGNKQRAKDLKLFLTDDDFHQIFGTQTDLENKIIEASSLIQRG